MAEPKISVIIPVYNAEKYLSACLESIINQTLKDIEIICVDDGSTDDSLKILKEYEQKDNRIKVYNQKNLNTGVARNNGIRHATGEYLHFLDADDYLYDEKIYQRAMEIIEKKKFPKVFRGRAKALDNKTNKIVKDILYEQKNLSPETKNHYLNVYKNPDEALKLCVTPWIGFVRRDFVLKHKIRFNNLKCCNDHSFFTECLIFAQKVYISSLYLVTHRINLGSSLINMREKHFDCQYKSFYLTKRYLKKHKVKRELRKKILVREMCVPLWFYFKYKGYSPYKDKNYLSLIRFFKKINPKSYEPYLSQVNEYSHITAIRAENYWKMALKYYLKKIRGKSL